MTVMGLLRSMVTEWLGVVGLRVHIVLKWDGRTVVGLLRRKRRKGSVKTGVVFSV